jgi:hypothetical protein
MKSGLYVIGLVTSVVAFVTACAGDNDNAKRKKFFGPGSGNEFTTVDVEAAATDDGGLSLAGTAAQNLKLKVSCDGIAEQVVEDAQFDLPVGAKNCKVKLVSMKIGDKTYVEPAGGSGFTHHLKRDAGKLVNSANSKEFIYVSVKKSLPSPLTADSSVQYAYSAVDQFDTIEASTAEVDPDVGVSNNDAPKIKAVRAAIGLQRGLNIRVQCTAGNGFAGSDLNTLTCDGKSVAAMKFAVDIARENKTYSASDLSKIVFPEVATASVKGKKISELAAASYHTDVKQINLNFGPVAAGDTKTRIFVVSSTSDKASSGYAYGFVKLNGTTTYNVGECAAQGANPNFVEQAVSLKTGIGTWRDTSNCWQWMRIETGKVLSKDRFSKCGTVTNLHKMHKLTLPYFTEMKAARDRNIHVLGKGAAPKLGANIDEETFWLAGGRVFNMKDGSVKEVKDVQAGEKHSVLCVIKRD